MPSNSGYSISSQSVITSEVPVVSGDILRSTDTPAVSPPGSTSSRRGSSSIADAVGIDLNAIGRGTLVVHRPLAAGLIRV